jgi:hypothetical protein
MISESQLRWLCWLVRMLTIILVYVNSKIYMQNNFMGFLKRARKPCLHWMALIRNGKSTIDTQTIPLISIRLKALVWRFKISILDYQILLEDENYNICFERNSQIPKKVFQKDVPTETSNFVTRLPL